MNDRDPGIRPGPEEPEAGTPSSPDPPSEPHEPESLDGAGPGPGSRHDDPEETLRRLLRDSVEPIEPSPGALDQLRLAVPARRRRRRQLLLGAAASVVLLGVGAPLMVTSAAQLGGGGGDARAEGGTDGIVGEGGLEPGAQPTGPDWYGAGGWSESPAQNGGGSAGSPGSPGAGDEPDDGAEPEAWETMEVTSPSCTRTQLGQAETVTREPDAEGRIYGAFRMVNVSAEPCRVEGTGQLVALPLGAADSMNVEVLDRTEGDQATGLPTPDESYQELILPPGTAYEVQFAFVPSASDSASACVRTDPSTPPGDPTEPPPPEESPTLDSGSPTDGTTTSSTGVGTSATANEEPDDETGGASSGGSTGDTGGTGGDGTSDGTGDGDGDGDADGGGDGTDAGVVLRYTPAAGAPEAAEVSLAGVCSGTVYQTGVLEAEPAS